MRHIGGALLCLVTLFLSCVVFPLTAPQKDVGRYGITAKAEYGEDITVHKYDVEMVVNQDRSIFVTESIELTFNDDFTMFYRSLPKPGAIYSDITAKCEGNDAFHYEVADNPDYDELLDINCIGNAAKGNRWTYDITYTMRGNTGDTGDNFIIDVIGFGWPVTLREVTVTLQLPQALTADPVVYVGFGSDKPDETKVQTTLSEDKKTLTMYASKLNVVYVGEYGERMAEGVTLDLTLPKGALESYYKTRFFTKDMWKLILGGVATLALAVGAVLLCKKRNEIVRIVNIKAPDDMDPMRMGKWLDGVVDNEDVTSMIYYFAHKGYLLINLQDEHDPVLIRKMQSLPQGTPVYERTLFEGLFKRGDAVPVSELTGNFYAYVEAAKRQLPTPKMYDKKSMLGFLLGGIFGTAYAFLAVLLVSVFNVGGGYAYPFGALVALPISAFWIAAYISENYRYKWKPSVRIAVRIGEWVVAALAVWIFSSVMAQHIMTGFELVVVCGFALLSALITLPSLSREEKYVKELGDILGFKDFIIYTEEDKIKFMLEENPELFYKILPYAQVLGVTQEWEDKFKNIVLEPPSYYVGSDVSLFDYLIFRQCMRSAMRTAMMPPKEDGHTVGRSSFGGGFGGFGGGGFGGGGGGAR